MNFFQERGVFDESILPYYPYRDDGLRFSKVLCNFAKDYINL